MLAKLNAKDQEQVSKFELYKEYSGRISQIKSYQVLALNRGENIGILSIKIEKSDESFEILQKKYASLLGISQNFSELLESAFKS